MNYGWTVLCMFDYTVHNVARKSAFFTRAGSLDLTVFLYSIYNVFVSYKRAFSILNHVRIFLFPLPDSCYVYSFHSFSRLTFCIAYVEHPLLKGWWFRYCILTRRFSWKIFDSLKTQDFLRLVKSSNFLTKRSFTIYIYIFLRNFEIFFMTNKVCKCSKKRIIRDIIKICKYSNLLVSNKFWECLYKYKLMYNLCFEILRLFIIFFFFKLDNYGIYNFFSKNECHSVFEIESDVVYNVHDPRIIV